jgi:hypothetical protein
VTQRLDQGTVCGDCVRRCHRFPGFRPNREARLPVLLDCERRCGDGLVMGTARNPPHPAGVTTTFLCAAGGIPGSGRLDDSTVQVLI